MEEAKRILIVEDDPILRDLLAEWLLAAGYRVGVAANGGAGIADARAHPPALVVTDMQMPGTGGAAVISEIGRFQPRIPVIAISAHFRSGHGLTPEEVVAHGAARALAKPFKRKDLVGAVSELVGPPLAA
jgi:CheY-like chemotaxis protein